MSFVTRPRRESTFNEEIYQLFGLISLKTTHPGQDETETRPRLSSFTVMKDNNEDDLKNKHDFHIAERYTALDIFCFAVFFKLKN